MWTKTPTAGGSGETWASVAKRHAEGGGVIDRWGGRASRLWAAANGAGEHGFVHPRRAAIHCVGTCGRALVVLVRAGAQTAGVVVINFATMGVAIIPVFKMFDWQRCVESAGGIVVSAAGGIVVSVAAITMRSIATVVEGGGTILGRVVSPTVVGAAAVVVATATTASPPRQPCTWRPCPPCPGGQANWIMPAGG
jgi:hypothetical protein